MPSNYAGKASRDISALRKPEPEVMSCADIDKIIRHLVHLVGWCEETEAYTARGTSMCE